ncbi:MAG: THUMP domain-containing protein [Brumimicrobium sp.]
MKQLEITIKTLFGLEEALKEEICELGYKNIKLLNRAVQVDGTWEDVYRFNYRCRLAIAVLVKIDEFKIHKEEDLYKKAKKIDWTSYFDVDRTFAVKGSVFSTVFRHTQYPLLLVKDAIADVFRDKYNNRPDVNVKSPQVVIDVHITDKTVVLSLNTNGLPLYQRGYRQEIGEAPINEVLAAGLLRLSGWDRKSTLIDPMTGSGTIAIEAALWAANIPAMIERTHYAFKNFKSYDEDIWQKVQAEGNRRPQNLGFPILAYDIDGEMIQKAKRNSKIAPIGNMIKFEIGDATKITAPKQKGIVICNPPYDERLHENAEQLYEDLGNNFKHNFVGFDCWIISSNMEALKRVGLHPSKKLNVFNGNLECSFRQFQIFKGSKKEHIIEELGDDYVEQKPIEQKAPIKNKEDEKKAEKEKGKYEIKGNEQPTVLKPKNKDLKLIDKKSYTRDYKDSKSKYSFGQSVEDENLKPKTEDLKPNVSEKKYDSKQPKDEIKRPKTRKNQQESLKDKLNKIKRKRGS